MERHPDCVGHELNFLGVSVKDEEKLSVVSVCVVRCGFYVWGGGEAGVFGRTGILTFSRSGWVFIFLWRLKLATRPWDFTTELGLHAIFLLEVDTVTQAVVGRIVTVHLRALYKSNHSVHLDNRP